MMDLGFRFFLFFVFLSMPLFVYPQCYNPSPGTLQVSPLPVNNQYEPSTPVNFCLTIPESDFTITNSNWLDGVVPSFGNGWDLSTLQPVGQPVEFNSGSLGSWIWTDSVVGFYNGNIIYEPGWFFDNDGDGNPAGEDDWGDDASDGVANWVFCWKISTVSKSDLLDSCTVTGGGADLNTGFGVSVYSDGATGGFVNSSGSCSAPVPGQGNNTVIIPCCSEIELSSTQTSCFGGADGTASVVITPLFPDYAFQYQWNTSPSDTTSTIDSLRPGIYSVTVQDSTCTITDSVVVYQPSVINTVISTTLDSCNTESGRAEIIASGGTGSTYTYSWHQTNSTSNIDYSIRAGYYTVTVSDSLGCNRDFLVVVPGTYPPLADFSYSPASPVHADDSIQFTDMSVIWEDTIIQWLWDFGDGNSSEGKHTTHAYSKHGTYNVKLIVYSSQGCSDTLEKTIDIFDEINEAPNVFTPNGDGVNDFFVVDNIESYPGSTLIVYNRWGNKVFEDNSYKNTWQGENLEGGVYYYILKLTDGSGIKTGFVTIIK